MGWTRFVDYVVMRELGQSDAVHRNYDLDHLNGAKPGQVLDRAFARMGFDQKNTARPFMLPVIRQHLVNTGYSPPLDSELERMVRQWYNWDRIRQGELRQWPLAPVANPLI